MWMTSAKNNILLSEKDTTHNGFERDRKIKGEMKLNGKNSRRD